MLPSDVLLSCGGSNMHGLGKDIDLSFLNGRQVELVAIGFYQIVFGLDEEVRISVYSEFNYFDGRDAWTWTPEPAAAQVAARTVALLGCSIASFEGRPDGTLSLTFSKGQRLTLLDSSKEFDSYDITRPGQTIIV